MDAPANTDVLLIGMAVNGPLLSLSAYIRKRATNLSLRSKGSGVTRDSTHELRDKSYAADGDNLPVTAIGEGERRPCYKRAVLLK